MIANDKKAMCNEEPHFLFYLWEVGFGVGGGLSLFCYLKSLLVHIGINMLPSLGCIRLIYFSKEREKMKLIEWNEKDRNVDLGPTTTMVLGFSIW